MKLPGRWLGGRSLAAVAIYTLGASCSADDAEPGSGGGGSGGALGDASSDAQPDGGPQPHPTLECDPLVPEYCLFPFPNDVFTREDPTSPTGRRLAIAASSLPVSANGGVTDPSVVSKSDGFSSGTVLLAYFPGATLQGMPGTDDLPASVEATSPTVVLDVETGRRVPHFVELDRTTLERDERSFMIRPVERLRDSARYIVAIRSVRDDAGTELAPSPAFAALRDGVAAADPSVEGRRALYDEIFRHLADAGVERSSLQLAWDFTTASKANNTGWLRHMRDEALAMVGADGPEMTIDAVDTDFEPAHVAFRIEGTMKVPLYLDRPTAGAVLLFGDDGLPEVNAATPTMDVPFEVIIPRSALSRPAALLQYGHGLFGSKDQIRAGHFASFANEFNYVFFGVDMIGMSSSDPIFIGAAIAMGRAEVLASMFDRMHQGMLNHWLTMRMMATRFARHPTYGAYLDPTERYYHGISQGGILGGVYVAGSLDVDRGVLGVMGQPYNLLLNRSVDFDTFFQLLSATYTDSRDTQLLLGLVQSLWDRVEPNGWTPYLSDGSVADGPKAVLMRAAIGDHQVPTLGGHLMARTVGARHLDTGIRDVFGLEKVQRTTSGSVYVEYEFGLPPVPDCNLPMRACSDPHNKIRALPAARSQLDRFLRTGVGENDCGGACSYPELSGCAPGEVPAPCPD